MQVTFEDNWVYVQTNDPAQKRMLELYHNAATSKKGWRLPKTVWVLRELVKGFPALQTNAALINEGKRLRENVDVELMLRDGNLNYEDKNHPAMKLRQYQRNDFMVLTNSQVAGVFNEPRTGEHND